MRALHEELGVVLASMSIPVPEAANLDRGGTQGLVGSTQDVTCLQEPSQVKDPALGRVHDAKRGWIAGDSNVHLHGALRVGFFWEYHSCAQDKLVFLAPSVRNPNREMPRVHTTWAQHM